jgi:voltage-gated potassium channel
MYKKVRRRTWEIVGEAPEGDLIGAGFNIAILTLIFINVISGIVETEMAIKQPVEELIPKFFERLEFWSVMIFTVEYILRLWSCTADPKFRGMIKGRFNLARGPMALVDLFAILPFYLEAILPGVDLRFIRVLRLLRLFRLFRVGKFADSFKMFGSVIKGKKEELLISLAIMMIVLILASSMMFMVEHGDQPDKFSSVPASMWWGMITITTIGYGDLYPVSAWGRALGSVVGFLGVCVFALPVGILGAGFVEEVARRQKENARPPKPEDVEVPRTSEDAMEVLRSLLVAEQGLAGRALLKAIATERLGQQAELSLKRIEEKSPLEILALERKLFESIPVDTLRSLLEKSKPERA